MSELGVLCGKGYKGVMPNTRSLPRIFAGTIMVPVLVLVAGIFLGGIDTADAGGGKRFFRNMGSPVTVMTRNLYVGANVEELFTVDPSDPLALAIAVAETLEAIEATNFVERSEALADEIARTEPDLIGLQEVALIRFQSPGDFLIGNPKPAETILLDYLETLLDALAMRGLNYKVAATIDNADIELPFPAGFDNSGEPLFDDARLTDRDVILKKSNIATSNVRAETYSVILEIPFGNLSIDIKRGYTAVDAKVRGQKYCFVNTHLEVLGVGGVPIPQIQAAQAFELIQILRNKDLPIILVGDFNSSPRDPIVHDSALILTPYWQLKIAGYADVWKRNLIAFGAPGFTCCQADDLRNEESELDRRIDHVFIRNRLKKRFFTITGPVFAVVVGDEPGDRTFSGLWPSDHAGVVARLKIPKLR